jgi:hypothetical protein
MKVTGAGAELAQAARFVEADELGARVIARD